MNSCPWHSAAARGGLCLGLVESFRGCSGAPVGRQHRADGYSRAAGEISPNPALCRGGCQAPARGPQVLCTPRCPFNQVAADASTTPHQAPTPHMVQLPTHRPSTVPATYHQGQGAGLRLVAPHGVAGRLPQHKGLREQRAPASPLPGRELPDAEAAGAKQLRQHKSTVTAPERLSPGVRKNTS